MSKFAAAFFVTTFAFAQTKGVEGDWQGTLSAGAVKLRIGLHISKDAAGNLTAKFDSIDQSAMGLPVKAATFTGNRLALDIAVSQASFAGTLSVDGSEIAGTFTQEPAYRSRLSGSTKWIRCDVRRSRSRRFLMTPPMLRMKITGSNWPVP